MAATSDKKGRDSVGRRVRDLRTRLGMTQADLAGPRYSAAYISTIETERRKPSRALLQYLAPRLGVDVGDLSGDHSAEWVIEMARNLRTGGRARSARDLLEKSLTNLESSGRLAPAILVTMHRELARSAGRRDLVEAERHLEQAVRYAERATVPRVDRALAFVELGDVRARRGRHREAARAYRAAAEGMLDLHGHAPAARDSSSGA